MEAMIGIYARWIAVEKLWEFRIINSPVRKTGAGMEAGKEPRGG
jgi:hypothetical protein